MLVETVNMSDMKLITPKIATNTIISDILCEFGISCSYLRSVLLLLILIVICLDTVYLGSINMNRYR